MDFNIWNNIVNCLLLNNFFFRWCYGSVGSVWYVSALFACYILFFAIKKYVKNNKISNLIVLAVFISGYIILEILKHGSFGNPGQNFGIFNVGFLRALGGFGLGMCIAELYKNFSHYITEYNFKKIQYFISLRNYIIGNNCLVDVFCSCKNK